MLPEQAFGCAAVGAKKLLLLLGSADGLPEGGIKMGNTPILAATSLVLLTGMSLPAVPKEVALMRGDA